MPDNITYKTVTPEDLAASFAAELQRLITRGITPEEEALARRYYSQKERDSMDESEFCGPHKSFPIKTQADIHNAASLAGHADNPAAVRACIKRKAEAHGWSLPKSWPDDGGDDGKKERAVKEASDAVVTAMPHESHQGMHSHSHSHMDGYSHEHEHEHANEADHDHPHRHHFRATGTEITSESLSVYFPIVRYDPAKREVFGQATIEQPDAYGTIFGFYPDAWTTWRGNMREQHDPKKAVGKALEVVPDREERSIYVTSRVSRGAQDTWLKIEDGVLSGYSASIVPDPEYGNDPKRWPTKEYNGKKYPYLPRYTVSELSYVDNPATPGCNIAIVRADGFVTDVVEEPEAMLEQKQETLDRAGARISHATQGTLHGMRDGMLQHARTAMDTCGCDECKNAISILDPDNDGDIDALGGVGDLDGDAGNMQSRSLDGTLERSLGDAIERLVEKHFSSVYTRLQGIAGTLARSNATPVNIESLVNASITRAIETIDARLASLPDKASLDDVRADVSAVKDQVAKIAETPLPGAPIIHTGAPDKRLPTDAPGPKYPTYGDTYSAIERLYNTGELNTVEKQVHAMAAGLAAQRRR